MENPGRASPVLKFIKFDSVLEASVTVEFGR